MSKPLKGFITYSHEDKTAKAELRKYLAVMAQHNELTTWDDAEITPGDEWYGDISKNLDEADILLYLVSAASLASTNCNKELAEALEKGTKIIPIILEYCDWQHHQLSNFEVLPSKGRAITKWENTSEGWQNVVDGIRRAINKIRNQANLPSITSEEEIQAELAFERGNVSYLLGQMEKAIRFYSEAIGLNPCNAASYNNRGAVYGEKGEVDLAIEAFSKAIELNSKLATAYSNRGTAYYKKGERDRAIEDFNKAIELNPDCPDAYNDRGLAYCEKGDLERAIADFNQAVQLDPERFSFKFFVPFKGEK